jgi:hypothetical protein
VRCTSTERCPLQPPELFILLFRCITLSETVAFNSMSYIRKTGRKKMREVREDNLDFPFSGFGRHQSFNSLDRPANVHRPPLHQLIHKSTPTLLSILLFPSKMSACPPYAPFFGFAGVASAVRSCRSFVPNLDSPHHIQMVFSSMLGCKPWKS